MGYYLKGFLAVDPGTFWDFCLIDNRFNSNPGKKLVRSKNIIIEKANASSILGLFLDV